MVVSNAKNKLKEVKGYSLPAGSDLTFEAWLRVKQVGLTNNIEIRPYIFSYYKS